MIFCPCVCPGGIEHVYCVEPICCVVCAACGEWLNIIIVWFAQHVVTVLVCVIATAIEERFGENIGEKNLHSFNLAETLCKFKWMWTQWLQKILLLYIKSNLPNWWFSWFFYHSCIVKVIFIIVLVFYRWTLIENGCIYFFRVTII